MASNKKITIGILAHVDAGKTTLSESLLYLSGSIRRCGRVDHGDTFLDTDTVERERGITIFSKQARFSVGATDFILLDTPGHVDFSAEAERILSLLDYAILVVSATDGIQNHTRTLWQLLEFYGIPTFIFVNKTDISIRLAEDIAAELAETFSENCVPFYEKSTDEELCEALALVDEDFLNCYLSGKPAGDRDISELVSRRRLFPCFFGSALKMTGVEHMISSIDRYTLSPVYDEENFSATVFKISNGATSGSGERLTYMKITGGRLSVRDEIAYVTPSATEKDGAAIREKVARIRLYSGERFTQVDSVEAGEVCAVLGLSSTYVGQGLGLEADAKAPLLEPVLFYCLKFKEGVDQRLIFPRLKLLEEEEPSLNLHWNEELSQIEARLMGEIQTEVIKRIIHDRFGLDCEFDTGRILYKEKVAEKTLGVGHFEPLRHYAEIQLIIEPQPKGTGLVFDTRILEGSLSASDQRLILSFLYDKDHRGTLTGAPLTDTKITLVAGRTHIKHTEGGDLREATLRAVRQGLMRGGCTLLEPYYKFRIEVPSSHVGRVLTDLQIRSADFSFNSTDGDRAEIIGRGPVSELHEYQRELISLTRGEGRMFCTSDGYEPCHDQDRVVDASQYDPEGDLENTPHSVFCAQGAGFIVPWDKVDDYKHLDVKIPTSSSAEIILPRPVDLARKYKISDDELESIMLREFGPIKRRKYSEPKRISASDGEKRKGAPKPPSERMVIVDGYNVIYSWDELSSVAEYSLEKARETLMDILSNYVAYTKTKLVLVFDAYLVDEGKGSDYMKDGYRVVFTRQDETADTFIERLMHKLGPNYSIRMVSGDRLLQFSAVHSGILRMTAKEFHDEVTSIGNEITAFIRRLSETN